MRILLSEKQFNLIILSEKAFKPGNVYPNIPYAEYSPEQIEDELIWFKKNGYSRNDAHTRNIPFKNRMRELYDEPTITGLLDEYLPKIKSSGSITPRKKGNVYNIPYGEYSPEQIEDELIWFKKNGYSRNDAYTNNIPFKNRIDDLDRIEKLGLTDLVNEYLPSRTFPKTPKEIEKIFNDILNHHIKTGEKLENDSDNYRFLRNYYYDFSGKIPKGKRDENTKSLKHKFYEIVGKGEIEYYGEKYIAEFLKGKRLKEDVDFFRTKTCKLPGEKCLYADFHLPKYNTIIEFDGDQHFRSVKWSKNMTDKEAELEFEKVKERDRKKNEYCKKEEINLYRIKHNYKKAVKKPSINEIMGRIFNDMESGSFNLTFDKIGYIETPESKNYKPRNKMNTDPMANFNESIYRILNNIKKQYIY